MSYRRGFAFTDLMVLLVLLAIAVAFVAPASRCARESSNRVKCASNLRQIGQAMLLYANENGGNYARTNYDANADVVSVYTQPNAKNPFAADGPEVNDVSAALYLLLRTQDLTPGVFVCPQSDAQQMTWDGPATNTDFSNFTNPANLSYSLMVPYPSEAVVKAGFKWNQTMPSDMALAADMNPGSPGVMQVWTTSVAATVRKANSRNHAQAGENVLFADGHVEFKQTPMCGVWLDNIYTYGISGNYLDNSGTQTDHGPGTGIVGRPAHAFDSILLPTALQGLPPGTQLADIADPTTVAESLPMALAVVAAVSLCVGVVMLIVLQVRRKKRGDGVPPGT